MKTTRINWITKKAIEHEMGKRMDNVAYYPWDIYDDNREIFDKFFHIEFSNGDKPGSDVRVMNFEILEK